MCPPLSRQGCGNNRTPAEQKLFRQLGVFIGGCTLSAIEAICNVPVGNEPTLQIDILRGVASLVDKSLVRQERRVEGEKFN